MATKLIKPVSREKNFQDVHGNIGPVVVTMSPSGITLRGKGKKRIISIPWESLKKSIVAPVNMPAKFSTNPIGWLIENSKFNQL